MNRQFDYANVKNPEYFCDGRMEAYSDHAYYASETDMVDGESLFAESLNGIWKFHYARNYGAVIRGFEKEEYCCASWDDIRVPAHIQMEGYDVPQYANTQYPWEGREDIRPGEIPEYFNPVASYVKYFSVPERMKGKRIFVSFQGAESGLAVWLNGVFIGYSEDSFTPSDFELTGYLKEGQNKLAVQVYKWTAGSWCEDQDFYRFSGLYRDVFLYTVPNVHIRDLRIRAIPDETLQKAELEIVSCTWGEGKARFVLSRHGKVFVDEEKELNGENRFVWEVDHPALWSAEVPNLYDLMITVTGKDGAVTELIPEKVGFRRFEMKDHMMTLNGKRIVFKGVNRHDFSSVGGRHVSEEELRKDLTVMKQNNINAIRTSHYPNGSLLYRLCDEYGLYLIDETNMETHGSWDTVRADGDDDILYQMTGRNGCRFSWTGRIPCTKEIRTIRRFSSGPAEMSPTVEKIFTKCHSFSARRIRPGWYIMKVYLTTADIMIRATWKVRCILRWRKSKNFLQKTGASRLSAVNIPMPWGIPAEQCISIRI